MSGLPDLINALQGILRKRKARCAIVSLDTVDESSLMGTRDGYLNLALALLQVVQACEEHAAQQIVVKRLEDEHACWSDNLKNALHQLPCIHPFIVGCYLFDDHASYLAALEEAVTPFLPDGVRLRNDPSFREPQ